MKPVEKIITKPALDMGIMPKKDQKDSEEAKYGSNFDPKMFKGNVDLMKAVNYDVHSKMK